MPYCMSMGRDCTFLTHACSAVFSDFMEIYDAMNLRQSLLSYYGKPLQSDRSQNL